MDQAAARGHPLHAALTDDAFVAGGIAVRQFAFEDEGDGLETAVWMRSERQAAIAGRIGLRAMVVEEQESAEVFEIARGQRAARDQVADIVAIGGV